MSDASSSARRELEQQVRIAIQRISADGKVLGAICDWLEKQDLPRLGGLPRAELQNDSAETRAKRLEQQTEALRTMLDALRHQVTKSAADAKERGGLRAAIKEAVIIFGICAAVLIVIVLAAWELAGVNAHHP